MDDFFEAILFLDLGNQFETLAIIVIFGSSDRFSGYHLIAALLVVPRRDIVGDLGSRL